MIRKTLPKLFPVSKNYLRGLLSLSSDSFHSSLLLSSRIGQRWKSTFPSEIDSPLSSPPKSVTPSTTTATSTTPTETSTWQNDLHHWMTSPRSFQYHLPSSLLSFLNENKKSSLPPSSSPSTSTASSLTFQFTLSNLAGHGSFLFLMLSYLENDFLHLRLYAFSGITLAMIFQYYREKPLWIPIRWNSIFLIINAFMILVLLKEENDANTKLSEEEKNLYKTIFEKRGMKPVDYLHLISIAKRLELIEGQVLIDSTKKNNCVYLVQKGQLMVRKGVGKNKNVVVGFIGPNQFSGEMSFLSWSNAVTMMEESLKQLANTTPSSTSSSFSSSSSSTPNDSNLAASTPGTESPSTQQQQQQQQQQDNSKWERKMQKTINKFLMNLSSPSTLSLTLSTNSQMKDGFHVQADVICDEDCVVYAWNFAELYELIHNYPAMGLIFERCLSEDLNRKFSTPSHNQLPLPTDELKHGIKLLDQNQPLSAGSSPASISPELLEEDMKLQYRQILYGALMDNEVNETEKYVLKQFREKAHISEEEHEQCLKEFSWSKEEFELGFKLGSSSESKSILTDYYKLLSKHLEQKRWIPEEIKKELLEYRMKNSIPTSLHLAFLKRVGWTLNEYEVTPSFLHNERSNFC